jgi:hypothetical protein
VYISWEDILNKTNAAYLVLSAIVAGLIRLYMKLRKEHSEMLAQLAKDRASQTILSTETALHVGWMKGLVESNERKEQKIAELELKNENREESRINDARMLAKRDEELVACRERVDEMRVERDLAQEGELKAREMLAAVQEHVNIVDGQMVAYRIANMRLFTAMPPELQKEMKELLLKQEPVRQNLT